MSLVHNSGLCNLRSEIEGDPKIQGNIYHCVYIGNTRIVSLMTGRK